MAYDMPLCLIFHATRDATIADAARMMIDTIAFNNMQPICCFSATFAAARRARCFCLTRV